MIKIIAYLSIYAVSTTTYCLFSNDLVSAFHDEKIIDL